MKLTRFFSAFFFIFP
ncbi:hypothetical protein AKM96_08430 [Salmonella enterica]|nr:hypothetical protein [Salmonella enterica]EAX2990008.1 hypothetical protein [Salmonella enterica]EAX2994762.1 hypothetical protein [Salmonella enterica]EAX5348307.1 hypothetical protein [Salmonella enterica]EAY8143786.1 hypothetical protein [Salmonella enterica]